MSEELAQLRIDLITGIVPARETALVLLERLSQLEADEKIRLSKNDDWDQVRDRRQGVENNIIRHRKRINELETEIGRHRDEINRLFRIRNTLIGQEWEIERAIDQALHR